MTQKLILVCDDVEDNRVVFQAVLEHAGYAVLMAESGAEALEQARAFTPSLILLDLMMPGLSGWETIARLKADPVTSEIPVVAVSASVEAKLAELAHAGFCARVAKPVLPRHLLDAVARCLAHAASEKAATWLDLPSYSPIH